jgi:anti-sigma factor RsiW
MAAALAAATPKKPAPRSHSPWQFWWGMGVAFAAGAMLVVGITTIQRTGSPTQDQLVGEVVDSHVRSLMASHLSDVASTDQHTVKPWFDGKVDFSPPVHDLASEGFPLVGGRMDYIDGHPVAALIYKARLHVINVFVWPVRDKAPALSVASARQGYNVQGWQADGMQFWAVSDVAAPDLQNFERLLQTRLAAH